VHPDLVDHRCVRRRRQCPGKGIQPPVRCLRTEQGGALGTFSPHWVEGTTLYMLSPENEYMDWIWEIPIRTGTSSIGYIAAGSKVKDSTSPWFRKKGNPCWPDEQIRPLCFCQPTGTSCGPIVFLPHLYRRLWAELEHHRRSRLSV
jgi:hypothetical protein